MASKSEREREHQRILEEVITDRDSLPKPRNLAPLYLVAVILITLLTLWVLPSDSLPEKPKLNEIPSLEETLPAGTTIPQRPQGNMELFLRYDDPTIKLVAAKVATSACNKPDKRCYADALYHFVQQEIAYLNDPINEYYELPQETLLAGAADCDGHAILLASLMRSVGILTRFKYTPGHVAVEAWLPENRLFSKEYAHEWELYDATCKQCRPGEARALP